MDVVSQLGGALTSGSLMALPLSLAGGVIAGLNPCCLALYPAAAATCCAGRDADPRRSAPNAVAFVLGIAVAMAALGIAISLAGRITGLGSGGRYLVALVPLLMGLHLVGWLHLPLQWLTAGRVRAGGAFGTGFLLSLVLGPCGTPMLAAVLSYAAYQGQMLYGALLLFLYGLGAGAPLLLVGASTAGLVRSLDAAGWTVWVDRGSGALLLLLGFYLLWSA